MRRTKPKFRMTYRSTVTVSRTKGLCTLTATRSPFSFSRPLYTCPRDAAMFCHKTIKDSKLIINLKGQFLFLTNLVPSIQMIFRYSTSSNWGSREFRIDVIPWLTKLLLNESHSYIIWERRYLHKSSNRNQL